MLSRDYLKDIMEWVSHNLWMFSCGGVYICILAFRLPCVLGGVLAAALRSEPPILHRVASELSGVFLRLRIRLCVGHPSGLVWGWL